MLVIFKIHTKNILILYQKTTPETAVNAVSGVLRALRDDSLASPPWVRVTPDAYFKSVILRTLENVPDWKRTK